MRNKSTRANKKLIGCQQIRGHLYDYWAKRLDEKTSQEVEKHLQGCQRCRTELEELKEVVNLLDQWKVPELSAGFEKRVMNRINSTRAPLHWLKEKIFHPLYIKLPLEGLAVAAVILLAITIYKGLTPQEEMVPRELKISIEGVEVKNPIIIETKDINRTLSQLKGIIQSHHGKVVQTVDIESGLRLTVQLKTVGEKEFFAELYQLGMMKLPKGNYRNKEGDLVIVLWKH